MTAARFVYRLSVGHVAKATIQADSASVIASWTRTADQYVNLPWGVALYPRVQKYAIRETTLSDDDATQGYTSFVLVFSALTPGMFAYLDTTFFSGGVESANVTLQIPNKNYLATNQTEVYQAKMKRPSQEEYEWQKAFVPIAVSVPFKITRATLL